MKSGYLDSDCQYFKLTKCRAATTPGSKGVRRVQDGDEPLSQEEHHRYRQTVGRLQWLCPIRPDLCYAVKELARSLNAPSVADQSKLKHVLRYLHGTLDFQFYIRPQTAASRI